VRLIFTQRREGLKGSICRIFPAAVLDLHGFLTRFFFHHLPAPALLHGVWAKKISPTCPHKIL
jgi:hypothetical protein